MRLRLTYDQDRFIKYRNEQTVATGFCGSSFMTILFLLCSRNATWKNMYNFFLEQKWIMCYENTRCVLCCFFVLYRWPRCWILRILIYYCKSYGTTISYCTEQSNKWTASLYFLKHSQNWKHFKQKLQSLTIFILDIVNRFFCKTSRFF